MQKGQAEKGRCSAADLLDEGLGGGGAVVVDHRAHVCLQESVGITAGSPLRSYELPTVGSWGLFTYESLFWCTCWTKASAEEGQL